MAINTNAGNEHTGTSSNSDDDLIDQINSPDLDDLGKSNRKAISSAKQAHAIAERLEKNNDERNKLNAQIIARYNGQNPFNAAALKRSGQGWRNNFSTKPMAGPVDRSATEFTDFVSSAPRLTNSSLPAHYHRAKEKTELFRDRTTELIRGWRGWNDYVAVTIKETILVGYASCAWLDDNWRPRFYRSDEIFYPDGVGQTPDSVQVVAIKWSYLIHDFWRLIKDREAAEAAGYHYDNCIIAINEATTDDDDDGDGARKQTDAARDFNTGSSYEKGSKSVNVWMVIATEIDGTCSLWVVRQCDGALIRRVDSHYDSMADVIGMMTIGVGSSAGYYNSMGMGRMILNPSYALDRARNMALDQLYLSGLVIVSVEGKSINNVQLRVAHPFVYIGDEKATVQSAHIQFDHQAFIALNSLLQALIQEIAGVYIPQKLDFEGGKRTATEASIDANREDVVKRGVLNRIWMHLSDIISAMQRKIYSPENIEEAVRQWKKYKDEVSEQLAIEQGGIKGHLVFFRKKIYDFIQKTSDKMGVFKRPETHGLADPEAVECIMNLLAQGLSEKEILVLAHSPTAESSQQAQVAKEQAAMSWLESQAGNPMINQVKSLQVRASKILGTELADDLVITPDDQAETDAGQWRLQALELATMMENQPVPVVQTDNHAVHQRMIRDKLEEMEPTWPVEATGPEFVNALKMVFNHHDQHTQFRLMLGETQQDLAEELAFDKRAVEIIAGLEQRLAQAMPDDASLPMSIPDGAITPDMIMGDGIDNVDLGQYGEILPPLDPRVAEDLPPQGTSMIPQ